MNHSAEEFRHAVNIFSAEAFAYTLVESFDRTMCDTRTGSLAALTASTRRSGRADAGAFGAPLDVGCDLVVEIIDASLASDVSAPMRPRTRSRA